MIKFLYLKYFLLLIPVVLFILLLYFKGGKKHIFSSMNDLKSIFKSNSYFYKIYYLLVFFIFIFYIAIFAKPVTENNLENLSKNGIDIQIVLDVSYSMLANDLEPNRLEVAKDVISKFVDKITSDRVGLIIYAGKTFTSLPLSFDYTIIKKTINKIDINTINQYYAFLQGTAIGDAMILAGQSFSNDEREKIIILLTDGEANKGIHPLVALDYINKKYNGRIKFYTIGIGGDKPTTVSIKNPTGIEEEIKIGGVDEKMLKLISSKTNGEYFRATNKDSFQNIFDKIGKLEKKEFTSDVIKINKERYILLIYLLIMFFFVFIILKKIKKI